MPVSTENLKSRVISLAHLVVKPVPQRLRFWHKFADDRWAAEFRSPNRWLRHSRGEYFLSRGGHRVAPPVYANLSLTNICNLKCSICGSQNMLGPVERKHMDDDAFAQVVATLFPLLLVVEFNSRGEPTLHPRFDDAFEAAARHGIYFRLQTNGTRFSSRVLDTITSMDGEVSISIDATGELFEYARKNARWSEVDRGTRALLARRDPTRVSVDLYPTLTAKTVEGAPALLEWAMEVGVDRVGFHLYDPIQHGPEERPTQQQIDRLKRHVATLDRAHPLAVYVQYERLKEGVTAMKDHPSQHMPPNFPRRPNQPGSNGTWWCMAPLQAVDIDLDGGVSPCCRTQERTLGYATSAEAFADCWFGEAYERLRRSLRRDNADEPQWQECRACIRQYTA